MFIKAPEHYLSSSLPVQVNRASVMENHQGWTGRVLKRLQEGVIVSEEQILACSQ